MKIFPPQCKLIYFCMIALFMQVKAFADNPELPDFIHSRQEAYNYLQLYLETADFFESQKDYEYALVQYRMALTEAIRLNENEACYNIHFQMGQAFTRISESHLALESFFQAYSSPYGEGHPLLKAKALRRIASIYQTLGEYETSYDYQLKALQISETTKDTGSIATSYYELGTIFFYQERFLQSLEYYQQAKDLFDISNNLNSTYACLAAIGSAYEKLGQIELALDYNLQSLRIAESKNYSSGIAYSSHNIGSNYFLKKDYARALEYLIRSMNIKLELKDSWGLISSYRTIALVYSQYNQFEKGKEYLEKALALSMEMDAKSRLPEIYKSFADAYRIAEKNEEAYEYLMKYVAAKDSVLSETTLKEMGTKKSMHEIQKKENEINLLKKQQEIYQKEGQINELYKYILIGSVLFFILILGLMYSRYRLQKITNALLEEKNEKINLQNDQLELANASREEANNLLAEKNNLLEEKNDQINSQNEALENSNEDLKQFAYVASHDLKEPLRMIGAYTTLLKKRYYSLFDADAIEFMGFITDAVGRMETMLTDLLSYSRVNTQQQLMEQIESRNIAEIVLTTLYHKITDNKVNVIINYDDFPPIYASRTQMTQLFQNLVSNALKFTKASDPVIEIGCRREEEQTVFFVRDNGIGIADENKPKIFEMFRRLHSHEEFEGSGIGLSTCKKIVEKHNGSIWLESEVGKGTIFFFSIPHHTVAAETPQATLNSPADLLPHN